MPRKFSRQPFARSLITCYVRAMIACSAFSMFLMPSRFEPCGLGQLIAMRYGSVPIVHAVGGLADTVQEYDPSTGEGNGFTFTNYDPWEFFAAIVRALELYRFKDTWRRLQQCNMAADHSWHASAMRYVEVYHNAIASHRSGK